MNGNYWRVLTRFVLLALVSIACTGCQDEIIHNLLEGDANKLLTKLHDVRVVAEKVKQPDGKWAITVSRSDALKAIKYLNDTRMLRDTPGGLSDKGSIISSREDQRFRFERSLSREIESTLSSISGVFEARVHLNLPQTDPLFGRALDANGTGSVMLIVRDAGSISPENVASLVGGASGIASSKISVLMSVAPMGVEERVGMLAPGSQDEAGESGAQSYSGSISIDKEAESSWLVEIIGSHARALRQLAIGLLIGGVGVLSILFFRRRKWDAFIRRYQE